MSRDTTAWVVGRLDWPPAIYSVNARVTAKKARLAEKLMAFDCAITLPLDKLDETPEAAIARWRADGDVKLANLRDLTARLEAHFATEPKVGMRSDYENFVNAAYDDAKAEAARVARRDARLRGAL